MWDMLWSGVMMLITLMGISFLCIMAWFYRDPERRPPEEKGVIVSPADGTIVYIKNIEAGEIPHSTKHGRKIPLAELVKTNLLDAEGWVIGIFMSALDVHVNRAPISGRVIYTKHTPGKFISMRNLEFELLNERNTIVIENELFRIGVVQIASHVVRRIDSYVKEGSQLRIGDRIGMVKLGSQVDLIIPKVTGLKIMVNKDEKVIAGESVVAKYAEPAEH